MALNIVRLYLLCYGLACIAQQPQGPGGKWNLAFEDNFDGSSLNTQKWSYNYTWGRTHNHRAYMVDSMVKIVNGQLRIKAKKERNPNAPEGTNQWSDQFGYIPFDYTAGAVHSNGKFNFTYGYLEGSFKAPSTLGTWPAFWTLNSNGAWPPEIDILEIPQARNQHHYYYHYKNSNNAEASFGTTHTGPDKSAGFHTYGVEWGPTYMKFYFDGQLLNSYTNRTECSQGLNMYIIINLAVGGWAGNIPSNAAFPCYYYADWVRAWKREPVGNLDFESQNLAPWGVWNNASQTTDCRRSGSKGVKLSGNPVSIEQTVELSANSTYIYGGYAKAGSGSDPVMFGVKNYGGDQIVKVVSQSNAFVKDSIIFKTGNTNTSAVIFFYKDRGTGSACGDDFFLYRSTVKDCAGIEGGTAANDVCNVCVGGNTKRNACKDLREGLYTLKPQHSNLCLEQQGSDFVQQTCNDNAQEVWNVTKSGTHYLLQNLSSREYLAINNAASGIQLSSSVNANTSALWRLEDAGTGLYYVVPSSQIDLVVDINGASTSAGAAALLYNRLQTSNQKFVFTPSLITGLQTLSAEQSPDVGYPNPFEKNFTIQQYGTFSYEILSDVGQILKQGKASGTVELGEDLKSGIYLLKITQDNTYKYMRIVKQ